MESIVIDYECPSCDGTGLYRGYFEKDGAAVVCKSCKGTGKRTFEAEPFTGRKVAEGVKRVFNPSEFIVAANDVTTKDGVELPFSQWGCTYGEWLAGMTPVPLKGLECPHMCNKSDEPLGDKCREGRAGGQFSDCPHFPDKAKCWEEYESAVTQGAV